MIASSRVLAITHEPSASFVLDASEVSPIGTMGIRSILFEWQCISDEGESLPDVALRRPCSTAGTLGMGYKMIIQFTDCVYLSTCAEGTMVGVEMKMRSVEPVFGAVSTASAGFTCDSRTIVRAWGEIGSRARIFEDLAVQKDVPSISQEAE